MIETKRLILRKLTQDDYQNLCTILQDDEAMYAYEGAFDDAMVHHWLDTQIRRYQDDGVGLLAVETKDGQFIGQCGLTKQPLDDRVLLEVGYLFAKKYWHQGYATEAAIACKEYAFTQLNADKVYSIIRDINTASQNVAKRNGMKCVDHVEKGYRGMAMMHDIYCINRSED